MRTLILAGLALVLNPLAAAAQAPPPPLVLPLACEINKTCFVQNYVDVDPGPDAKDFTCGTRSYERHSGTDFRVPTMADQKRGVAVLAAAPGTVLRVRDGEPDVSVRERGTENLDGKDCGNGLVVDHGQGWTSQYCHMAKGSLVVKPGDKVTAGQKLGLVGLSGRTEYPHLHLTLRRGNDVVDPFAVDAAPGTCGTARQSAWAPGVREALAYRPRSLLNAGFSAGPVTMEQIESGEAGRGGLTVQSPALVAFVRSIGLKAGDVQRLVITGPDGKEFLRNEAKPLAGPQAQTMVFAGRKRPDTGFPPGEYTVRFEVLSGGAPVLTHTQSVRLGS